MRRRIITEGHAVELLRLSSEDLQNQLAKRIEEGLSVMGARKIADKMTKVKRAAEKKPSKGFTDHFVSLWPNLMANTAIDVCGYWDVAYKKEKWSFSIGPEKIASHQDFATWFRQLAEQIEKAAPSENQVIQAIVEPVKEAAAVGM